MTVQSSVLAGPSARPSGLRPDARDLLRTTVTSVLLALLVAWMFTAWWSAPRSADVADLERDLAGGEVTSYVRIDSFGQEGIWANPPWPKQAERGDVLVWQTAAGHTFYVAPDARRGLAGPPDGVELELSIAPPSGRREIARLERELGSAGVPQTYDAGSAPTIGFLLVASAFLLLVAGPAPRRGTRWFWFWVGGISAGLGVLAWLVLERIRPPADERPVVHGDVERRWHGAAGFGCLLLSSILVGLFLGDLRDWLGPWIIPG